MFAFPAHRLVIQFENVRQAFKDRLHVQTDEFVVTTSHASMGSVIKLTCTEDQLVLWPRIGNLKASTSFTCDYISGKKAPMATTVCEELDTFAVSRQISHPYEKDWVVFELSFANGMVLASQQTILAPLESWKEQFENLKDWPEFMDIDLICSDKVLKTSQIVLATQSPVFAKMITENRPCKYLYIPEFEYEPMFELVRGMFTGRAELTDYSLASKVSDAAVHFQVEYLVQQTTAYKVYAAMSSRSVQRKKSLRLPPSASEVKTDKVIPNRTGSFGQIGGPVTVGLAIDPMDNFLPAAFRSALHPPSSSLKPVPSGYQPLNDLLDEKARLASLPQMPSMGEVEKIARFFADTHLNVPDGPNDELPPYAPSQASRSETLCRAPGGDRGRALSSRKFLPSPPPPSEMNEYLDNADHAEDNVYDELDYVSARSTVSSSGDLDKSGKYDISTEMLQRRQLERVYRSRSNSKASK